MFLTERFFFNYKYFFSKINLNKKSNQYNNLNLIDYNFFISFFIIYICDKLLCYFFGKKGRYYQLHSLINIVITYRIYEDIKNFLINPLHAYRFLYNHNDSYLILSLHLYHFYICRTLNLIEKMHHLLFVAFGVVPVIFYIKTNQIYLGYVACAGIPGIFEYGLLTLLKNNIISLKNQKYFTAYLYNYFRYPLALYGCFINLICWKYNNILNSENVYLSIYINFLLFVNGSFFNHLTLKSYYIKNFNFN